MATPEDPIESVPALSTLVVGRLTEIQKNELKLYGSVMLDSLGIDPQDKERVADIQTVIEDCVHRGLRMAGRPWVTENETLEPMVDRGLDERQRIVNRLQSLSGIGDGSYDYFFSRDESDLARTTTPFTADMTAAEALISRVQAKRGVIAHLHRELFHESRLAPQAAALMAQNQSIGGSPAILVSTKEGLYEQLMGNLVISYVVKRRASLAIEPKDVSFLSELWSDQDVRDRSIQELTQMVEALAGRMKLPYSEQRVAKQALQQYIGYIAKKLEAETEEPQIRLEQVATSGAYIVSSEALVEEQQELTVALDTSVDLTRNEVREAQKHAQVIIEACLAYDQSLADAKLDDDPIENALFEQYSGLIKHMSSLDLIYLELLIQSKGNRDIEAQAARKIHEDIDFFLENPARVFIGALRIAHASRVRYADTSEGVDELNDSLNRDILQTDLRSKLLNMLSKHDVSAAEIIEHSPNEVIPYVLDSLDSEEIDETVFNSILGLSDDQWFAILQNLKFSYDDESGQLVSEAETNIKSFFLYLPENRQKLISRLVAGIVQA